MGQVASIKRGNGRILSDIEMKAIAYLTWIRTNLGETHEMVPYFTAMLVQEISEGPVLSAKSANQLALGNADLPIVDAET
jgi:hypothetical protein